MKSTRSQKPAAPPGAPWRRREGLLTLLWVGLAVLAVAGALSGPGASRAGGDGGAAGRPLPAAAPHALVLALDVQPLAAGGETAYVLALGVMSTHAERHVVVFPDGQAFDFVVEQDGRELWRWSAGRAFSQAVVRRALEPGRLYLFTAAWDGRDAAGRPVIGEVQVRAVLTAEQPLAAPPAPLHLD